MSGVVRILRTMTQQLHLLSTPPEWKLSEATREIGRRGLADARAVLRSIPRRFDDEGTDEHRPAAA